MSSSGRLTKVSSWGMRVYSEGDSSHRLFGPVTAAEEVAVSRAAAVVGTVIPDAAVGSAAPAEVASLCCIVGRTMSEWSARGPS